MECAYHPGAESVGTCVACEKAVCEACREEVAGHPMCRPCVEAEQARVQSEQPEAAEAAPPPPAPCGFAQYVKAILFAGAAAVLGALVWDKFVLWTGIQLGLIAVAVGWVVATALCMGAEGRPGKLLPWLGAILAAFGIMLGYGMLHLDVVTRQQSEIARDIQSLPHALKVVLMTLNAPFNLDLMDWVFVAIGIWEGWSIPSSLNRRAQEAAPVSPDAT